MIKQQQGSEFRISDTKRNKNIKINKFQEIAHGRLDRGGFVVRSIDNWTF
jgi:hypothetical protein